VGELGLDYAALCLVVNWAAGVAAEELDMSEILKTLQQGMDDIKKTIFIFANQ
jgi:5'-methylthioinosine phosphorylase